MQLPRRAVALPLFILTLMSAFASAPASEEGGTPRPAPGIVALEPPPPDERPILDTIAANDPARKTVIGRAGIAGIALGVIVAASGFALMYRASGSDPDAPAIHGGIGLVVSGGLIAALSSAAARYPGERKPLTEKE